MRSKELTENVIRHLNEETNHMWELTSSEDPYDDEPMDVVICAKCGATEPVWTAYGFDRMVRVIRNSHPDCDTAVVKQVQNS